VPYVFDNYSVNLTVDGIPINLILWESSNNEDYDKLRSLMYPQTTVFILAFSLICPSSLENVRVKWLPEIKHYCPNTPYILCGMKQDLLTDKEVISKLSAKKLKPITYDEGKSLAREIGASYVECSALNVRVAHVFDQAIASCLQIKKATECILL